VAVNAPPTMPPITITGIIRMNSECLSCLSTLPKRNGCPVSGNPRCHAIQLHSAMKPKVMSSPGITPAMNMPPTETVEPAMNA
jgi:hypothetical protein